MLIGVFELLALKQEHPGPDGGRLNSRDIDLSLEREQICVTAEAADHYTRKHPERGMPFALPPLSPAEQQTVERWLESGAPYAPAAASPSGSAS